jgi:hypothetical protein
VPHGTDHRAGYAESVARLAALAFVALLVLPVAAFGDGDPASDVLVFEGHNVFLPYAPPTSAAAKARIAAATVAAAKAGFPIKVAVISGPGDLGAVPQMAGRPQEYADFLGQEIALSYTGALLVVMPEGYGLTGTDDAAAKAAVSKLAKPKSGDPDVLAGAGADAVKVIADATGHPITIVASAPPDAAQPKGTSGGSSSVLYVVGGTAVAVVLLAGLVIWVRRAPAPQAPSS